MTAVPQATANGPMPYRRRRPERTVLYRTVQAHFETWLAPTRDSAVDSDPVPAHVEREFRRYLGSRARSRGRCERKAMIVKTHALPVKRQAELL